jgi:hypothetical protein
MAFTMRVETGNAAFQDDTPDGERFFPGPELARILRDIAERVNDGQTHRAVYDINGNRVGSWEITEEEQ